MNLVAMDERRKVILSGRLNGRQRNKLKGLLDMDYKPGELAEELGIRKNLVYSVYVKLGCPLDRDQWNHIAINGKSFRGWYLENYRKARVEENESFCKSCQRAVKIEDGVELKKGSLTYIVSHCPKCGRVLSKITGCEKRTNDKQN